MGSDPLCDRRGWRQGAYATLANLMNLYSHHTGTQHSGRGTHRDGLGQMWTRGIPADNNAVGSGVLVQDYSLHIYA